MGAILLNSQSLTAATETSLSYLRKEFLSQRHGADNRKARQRLVNVKKSPAYEPFIERSIMCNKNGSTQTVENTPCHLWKLGGE